MWTIGVANRLLTLGGGVVPTMPVPFTEVMPFFRSRDKSPFPLNVPIVKFGKLIIAGREESEELCGINNLLSLYIREREHYEKPISIAVFGPPGTGKSFAVKEIAETIDPNHKTIETMEYNIAQFRNPGELGPTWTVGPVFGMQNGRNTQG